MKKNAVIILLLLTVIIPATLYTQTMSDYCSISPSVTRAVPPNVTIILDNSAAMLLPAYPLTDDYNPFSPTAHIGYFDPRGLYCARTDLFYETSERCGVGERGPYPGALLNWATMSRYDMIMYLLAGGLGSPEPGSPDLRGFSSSRGWTKTTPHHPHCAFTMSGHSLSITGEACDLRNPGTKIIVRNGRRERGLIAQIADRNQDGALDAHAPRFSLMTFRPRQNDVTMPHCIGKTNTLNSLYGDMMNAVPDETSTHAPLGKAVIRAVEYFKNSCPACNDCADPVDALLCRKNFVIIASSGDATDIPSPYSAAFVNEEMRKSHTEDIRPDRSGTQIIQYFTINVLGSETGEDILKDFSRYGGFTDKNGNKQPDLNSEWDRNGDGLPDAYFDAQHPVTLRSALERAFADISSQTASGAGVAVLSSAPGGAGCVIQAQITPLRSDGEREVHWTGQLQSLWIDPQNNLREDSIRDHRLILDQDQIVKYFFHEGSGRTKAALFSTLADGSGGSFSACSAREIREAADVKVVWESGRKLALRDPSSRRLFTSKRIVRGGVLTHSFPEEPYPAFQTTMNSLLLSALNPDPTYTSDTIVRYIRGECLETGVTGDAACGGRDNTAFRDRRVTLNSATRVWKLGDIMNSTPAVMSGKPLNTYHIDYADRSYYDYISADRYRRRSSVVFVGANDGMLHAFRGGYLKDKGLTGTVKAILKDFVSSGDDEHERLGEEIWAFIPFNAFPYLKYLANPEYCHINYSDLSVRVIDVSFQGGVGVARDENSWKTILLGGMRFGGACGSGGTPADPPSGTPGNVGYSAYFALDVTVPEKPVPLWEFSDDDLGYTASAPAVVRTGDGTQNGKWHVIFGSGSKVLPKSGRDIGRNAPGFLYIVDLKTGELAKKISLDHNAIVGDVLAVDADRDYITEKVYFGTSYTSDSAWMGKVMSLDVPAVLGTSSVPVPWSSSFGAVLFSGRYPFTASPEAAKDPRGSVWIYAGSGKYFSDIDETDASQQIAFGLRDKNNFVSETSLYDATQVLTRGQVTATERMCVYDVQTEGFGFRDVVTSIKPLQVPLSEVETGWKIYFSGGERVISRPAAVGGILDFLTYRPDADPCALSGESFLYSVSYATGMAPAKIALRSPDITSGTSGIVTVHKGVRLGKGAPPSGDAILFRSYEDAKENGDMRKNIQIATGAIAEAENRPFFPVVSRIVHWLKK